MNKNKSELSELKQLRDELAVQAHLFNMEMRDEWRTLEERWEKIQADLSPAAKALSSARNARHQASEEIKGGLIESYHRFHRRLNLSSS